jgi:hypothetical protein
MTNNLSNRYLNGNMHPADALAEVREQMAELKKIEAELRDQILSNQYDRSGQMFKAEVVMSAQRRIDPAAVAAMIGDIEKVKKAFEVTFVLLKKIEVDA